MLSLSGHKSLSRIDMSYILGASNNLLICCCLFCVHRWLRRENGWNRLVLAILWNRPHTVQWQSPCFRLQWRAGFSYFPLHELKMSAREHLGQDRMDMKLQTTATMNVVKIKWSPRKSFVSEMWGKSWQFSPHSLWQHSKWRILYLFFYSWYEFFSPSLMKVIYFLRISSECLIGRESAHIDCCKYLSISWIKKVKAYLKIVWVFIRMFSKVIV